MLDMQDWVQCPVACYSMYHLLCEAVSAIFNCCDKHQPVTSGITCTSKHDHALHVDRRDSSVSFHYLQLHSILRMTGAISSPI